MVPVIEANNVLFKRYLEILQQIEPNTNPSSPMSIQHLIWMCKEALARPDMYVDKHSRWLGYVQGVMAMRLHIDPEEEREFSRELFHEAYRQAGLPIPDSIGPGGDDG